LPAPSELVADRPGELMSVTTADYRCPPTSIRLSGGYALRSPAPTLYMLGSAKAVLDLGAFIGLGPG